MGALMRGTEHKPFFEHFRRAAGLSEGRYQGAKWNDGDFYKWTEAASVVAALTGDQALAAQLDEMVAVVALAQRADGYLHTPVLIGARLGEPDAVPFHDRFDFEMYNLGHLLTAACTHHEATGQENFLAVARKAGDFLCQAFAEPDENLARNAVCPSHYMGIIDLYRATGEARYLELAGKLVAMRDLVAEAGTGGDDNQDRLPLAEQTEIAGHAVRANYLYAGLADLYAESGDPGHWAPLAPLWQSLVTRKLSVTGGCGALYDGASPDASPDQAAITRVHQAYGRNYQLPNTTAHNETCASVGLVLWAWRMFLATGEAEYVDVLETALYNTVLAGASLDGTRFSYVNPLRVTDPPPADLRWSRQRVEFVTSFCCPPNVVRTVATAGRFAYAHDPGAGAGVLRVNLYGSNTLESVGLKLRQESRYPWDGTVTLTFEAPPPDPLALNLRIPGWCQGATLTVNGEPAGVPAEPGTYATVQRTWQPGDQVALTLPMPPVLVESHPLVEESRNHAAVQRGPLVYCLESADLPGGVSPNDVLMPPDAQLTPRHDPGLLDGVTVLEGKLLARPPGEWTDKLYRPLTNSPPHPVSARLVPYYTWGNRGPGEMTVWVPLAAAGTEAE
jgi:DUF1680 family protein